MSYKLAVYASFAKTIVDSQNPVTGLKFNLANYQEINHD
jgi:hypothetical protein